MSSKTGFLDPGLPRKSKLINEAVKDSRGPLWPSVVEVSESGTCNRSCSFCPRSDPLYPDEKKFVTNSLILKLVKELSEIDYSGIFAFSGFCEPLLDKNIYSLIQQVRERIPSAHIELTTNGDPLNRRRLERLFESGLDLLLISAYDGPEQVSYFREMGAQAGLDESALLVRPRFLSADEDFGITLSNRGGMMDVADHAIPSLREPLMKKCNYPFYSFFMDFNGDVLLCPHDWGRKMIIGNMYRQTLSEIWLGEVMDQVREKMINKNRRFSPCDVCDVDGELMGNPHVEYWESCRK